jgi:anti-anti-sigma factor
MTISFKKSKDFIIILLNGSLDTKLSKDIEEDFEQILSQYPKMNILINMKELKYLSSSGLRTIVSLRSVLNDVNLELRICNMGRAVKDVFEMTKVLQFFKVYQDEESALLGINELNSDEID